MTESEDFWQVGRLENSTLLILTTNEYADWYEKRGGELKLEWRPDPYVTVAATGFYQHDISLRRTRTWTVFGDHDHLPDNPSIDDGDRRGARLSLVFDSRDDENYSGSAWRLFGNVEAGRLTADSTDGPDLDYTVFTLGAYRYNMLPWMSALDLGARLFSSFGDIPAQLTQSLGGWAGVRGTSDAPFVIRRGDRLMLLSAELRRELPLLPVLDWIYSRWDFVLFADAGFLTVAEHSSRPFHFLETTMGEWKKSVGLGVSGDAFIPYLALYVAQELDTVGDRPSPRFILRMRKSF
jgi:hypothetical protein